MVFLIHFSIFWCKLAYDSYSKAFMITSPTVLTKTQQIWSQTGGGSSLQLVQTGLTLTPS
jgi:hypothetical protein